MLMRQTKDNDGPCVEHTGHSVGSGVTAAAAECHRPDTMSSPLHSAHKHTVNNMQQ